MIIELNKVSKKIGGDEILKNISIKMKKGKIYGFVGRNGSGKSMLFKTICGFIEPTSGNVLVNSVDLYRNYRFPESIGATIDEPRFIESLTGFENLKLLSEMNKIITDDQINETLKNVNLFGEKDKKVLKYSLGMKRKLAIASVIMESPEIMIFDEPFNGLDDESVLKIRDLLLEFKKKGKLILISTHIKDDIDYLCDNIYKLDLGSVIEV